MICGLRFSALWAPRIIWMANATRAVRIDTLETIARHDATIAPWGARYRHGRKHRIGEAFLLVVARNRSRGGAFKYPNCVMD